MGRYVLKRAIEGVLALWALSIVVFLVSHATGDPARYLLSPEASTAADYARLKHLLGLDQPLITQYWIFLRNLIHGELGTSFYQSAPVRDLILQALPVSLQLAIPAMLLSVVVGVPAGVVAAMRRGTLVDKIVTALSTLSMAAPQFWIGIMLLVLFVGVLHLLPAFGYGSIAQLILPVVTLSLSIIGGVVRLTRSSMLDVLGSDFVRFARIKGLPRSRVVWKHALKNALIPVLTYTGILLGQTLGGAVVVETVFGLPGLGRLSLNAAVASDFPIIQAVILLGGLFFVVASFTVDVLYAYIDPRMRESERRMASR
jgi:peptide/nickel transport system permease protein